MGERRGPRRVALVTGASSGIGAAVSKMLTERGDTVVLAARREDRLRGLAEVIERTSGTAIVRATDLSRSGAGDELVRWVSEELGRLDLLVNNAGFGKQSWFHEMEPDVTGRMFQVNVLSPMELSRAAIPLMRRGSGGSIVNVASVGGVVSHPLNVAYCASKHALVGFSKSLRLELKGSGINVVAVCPAATRTEFFEQARGEIPFDTIIESNWVPADTVARAVVRSEHSHHAVVFPTWGAWFLAWADRWLPWASELGNLRYRDRVLANTKAT